MNDRDKLVARLHANALLLDAIASEGNFTRAGQAIGIEQSAVSHRISSLEKFLGARLFERTTRQLQPTEVGQMLCNASRKNFILWEEVVQNIHLFRSSNTARLSVSSSVSLKWIIPALQRARATGLELAIDVEDRVVDLHSGVAQASIRYGRGPYPGLHAETLSRAALIPVARPGLLSAPLDPSMLGEGLQLLGDSVGEVDGTDFNWTAYFKGRGWSLPVPRMSSLSRSDLTLQAAISGSGVALGRTLLVEDDIATGLLEVVGPPVQAKARYWLVCTPAFAKTQGYATLRDWLLNEVTLRKL